MDKKQIMKAMTAVKNLMAILFDLQGEIFNLNINEKGYFKSADDLYDFMKELTDDCYDELYHIFKDSYVWYNTDIDEYIYTYNHNGKPHINYNIDIHFETENEQRIEYQIEVEFYFKDNDLMDVIEDMGIKVTQK